MKPGKSCWLWGEPNSRQEDGRKMSMDKIADLFALTLEREPA
jgi:hypothetical protein